MPNITPSTFSSTASIDRDAILQVALAHHKARRFIEAQRGYQTILNWRKDDSDVLYLMGMLELQLGQTDSGIDGLGRAIIANPRAPHFHVGLAKGLLKKNSIEGARNAFQRALALKPDYVDAFVGLTESTAALARRGNGILSGIFDGAPPRTHSSDAASFSVIVCSIDEVKKTKICKHYEALLAGHDFEIIQIPDAKSLAEGYNRGAAQSRGSILIFSHDDIEILSADFARRLICHLSWHDVVGVAGTSRLVSPVWSFAGRPHLHGYVVRRFPEYDCFRVECYGPAATGAPIQALDGILIAASRKVCTSIPFDQATFDGFHLYDIDFTFSAYSAGFRIGVAEDILVLHESRRAYDGVWARFAEKFSAKQKGRVAFPATPQEPGWQSIQFANRTQVIEFHGSMTCAADSRIQPAYNAPRLPVIDDAPCLFDLPAVLPPASAWIGHIPFLFLLFKLARPRTFVELGVHHGASFVAGCEAASRYSMEARCFGVDTWQGDDHTGPYESDRIFESVSGYIAGRYSNCELMRMTFDEALERFEDGSIDLLHIDGYHTYEAVFHDYESWRPKLSDRSIVLFHDIQVREADFGVWKLWEELKATHRFVEFQHCYGLGALIIGKAVVPEVSAMVDQFESNAEYRELLRELCEAAGTSVPLRIQQRDQANRASTAQPIPART